MELKPNLRSFNYLKVWRLETNKQTKKPLFAFCQQKLIKEQVEGKMRIQARSTWTQTHVHLDAHNCTDQQYQQQNFHKNPIICSHKNLKLLLSNLRTLFQLKWEWSFIVKVL